MNPLILLVGLGLFIICLVCHILIWRRRHPKRHALALFIVFIVPVIVLTPLVGTVWPQLPLVDLAAVMLLHVSLSCAYIQFYPASQADSPSLRILLLVGKSMPLGMTESEICSIFDPKDLFEARVDDLLSSGLIQKSSGKLTITTQGRVFILPFIVFRNLLGLPLGEG